MLSDRVESLQQNLGEPHLTTAALYHHHHCNRTWVSLTSPLQHFTITTTAHTDPHHALVVHINDQRMTKILLLVCLHRTESSQAEVWRLTEEWCVQRDNLYSSRQECRRVTTALVECERTCIDLVGRVRPTVCVVSGTGECPHLL